MYSLVGVEVSRDKMKWLDIKGTNLPLYIDKESPKSSQLWSLMPTLELSIHLLFHCKQHSFTTAQVFYIILTIAHPQDTLCYISTAFQ